MKQPVQVAIGATQIHHIDGLYSLNDLHRASGGLDNHRPAQFMRTEQTQAMIAELCKSAQLENCVRSTRGKHGGTYVCRELVYAYAMWISAAFSLTVIRAFDAMYSPQAPYSVTPNQTLSAEALSAARKVALDYFDAIKAGQKNPRVNDIPEDVLTGIVSDMLMNNRYLLSFDAFSGRLQLNRIDPRAFVVTPDALPGVMRESLSLSTHDLFDIQAACHERLRSMFGVLEEKAAIRQYKTRSNLQ